MTEDDAIKSKVIKSTNSQTSISAAVLSATDPIHRSIEDYFKHNGLYYDRRKNYWKNEKKPKNDIVSISLLSQTFKAIILQEPHISRAKPSSLVKNEDDYKQIFNQEYDLKGFLKLIQVQRILEEALKGSSFLEKGEGLNIRYFVYMHFVLSQRANQKEKILNPKEYLDDFIDMELDNNQIEDSISSVYKIFTDLGKTDGIAKSKTFTEAVIKDAMEE